MIVIKGLDSLMRKLTSLGGNLEGALTRAVKQTTEAAEKEANILKPYSSISTKSDVKEGIGAIEGTVSALPDWALYVEFGTGPKGQANHAGISPNVPVSYTSHSWVYPTGDGEFRRTSGQPAKPFLYPTSKIMEPVFVQAASNEIRNEIRKAGG
jgi:hypothetical protein